ncbi:MAG: hypothetical protein AAFY02_11560 [Pseudomonadota bacterium]
MTEVLNYIVRMKEIITKSNYKTLSTSEQCSYFSALHVLYEYAEKWVSENGDDAYQKEKIRNSRYHAYCALDFLDGDDHAPEEHITWALADAQSLSDTIRRKLDVNR